MVQELADIINGCKENNPVCQEKVYNLYAAKMYAVSLRYAGSKEDANDILQDGFIKVFDKIDQFSGKGSFEGWIRKIIVNTALSRYRAPLKTHLPEYLPDIEENETDEYEGEISTNVLLDMIAKLPPQYKMVFNLYALDGYSHAEVSEMLGISISTSKSNLSRARGILKNKVNDYLTKNKKPAVIPNNERER